MVGSVSKIHDRISNLFYVFSDRATLELPVTTQCSQFVTLDRVHARRSALASPHMQAPGVDLDLVPLEIAHLRSPQPMSSIRNTPLEHSPRRGARRNTTRSHLDMLGSSLTKN
jgi:hypothetical protein